MRSAREMMTIMMSVDLICQGNSAGALDVLLQRQKALEINFAQGQWTQANLLELIPDLEEGAIFREELKAVQKEEKFTLKLAADQWQSRPMGRWKKPWAPTWLQAQDQAPAGEAGAAPGADPGGVAPNSPAPLNLPGPPPKGKGKKGKGKGKKGVRRWYQ